jgi:hypothetical protein
VKHWLVVSVLSLTVLTGGASGRSMTPEVQDSIYSVHPRMRAHWLKERGIDLPGFTSPFYPDSLNITCVGRWSYGPSYDITGRIADHDTVLFLARGSGVSVLQFHGGAHPTVSLLSDINCMGLTKGVEVQDSWLYVATAGIEIYNIARPASPTKLCWVNSPLNALAVQDTVLYAVSDDSFKVFSVSDRARPSLLGACRDSGDCIAVAGSTAFLGQRWGLYLLDVSNPSTPHRVGSWGTDVISVAARRDLCYACTYDDNSFHILNVSNPNSPQELSHLGVRGWHIFLDGNEAYLPCFALIDVADSTMPGIISQIDLAAYGAWSTGLVGHAFTASLDDGLGIVDLTDPVHPVVDTSEILAYSASRDIAVDGGHAVVAQFSRGLRLLSVADRAHPVEIASYDSTGQTPQCDAARLNGTTAYMGWIGWDGWRGLYVISFEDSADPVLIGKAATFNPIRALAIRDSWAYVAERTKFEVVSIMDSAHPVTVSTCSLGFIIRSWDVDVGGGMAYVADEAGGLRIIDVSQPRNATPVGNYVPSSLVYAVAVVDTIAYVGTGRDLEIINVRDLTSPYEIGSYDAQGVVAGVQVHGSRVIVSSKLTILDVSNPVSPRVLGFYDSPLTIHKLCWVDSLVYACSDDGIIILNCSGVNASSELPREQPVSEAAIEVAPNPTSGKCQIRALPGHGSVGEGRLYDSGGRLVRTIRESELRKEVIDLSDLSKGVYILSISRDGLARQIRVVLTN